MMLFDIIRNWFVMNIWGGVTSNGDYFSTTLGSFAQFGDFNPDYAYSDSLYLPTGQFINGAVDAPVNLIVFGDWLSTTSTIIVLIALCFFFFLMVRWLFRLTAGLIQGRG